MPQKQDKKEKSLGKLKISFTSKLMTAYGGTYLLAELFSKFKVSEFFESYWPVKETSNNSKGIYPKVLSYWLSIIAGGKRFSHIILLDHSLKVLAKSFGIKKLAESSSTLTRFIGRINKRSIAEILRKSLWQYMESWIPWDKIESDWLDGDSTVLERYGSQEGSKKGYNTKKPGRPSHHPLLLFLGNNDYLLNLWNRSGNTYSSNNIIGFIQETLSNISDKIKVIGFRLDSGFYDEAVLKFLKSSSFIISAKLYRPLKRLLYSIKDWEEVESGIEVAKFYYRPSTWDKEYIHVAIRQNTTIRPSATGKQLKLFEEIDIENKYRYSVMVTNINEDAKSIWDKYKPRATCEQRIAEAKEDFALGGYCLKNFWATEIAMMLRMLLYNIFVFFRTEILSKPRVTLKTVRPKYFIIPGILGKNGKQDVLRLGVSSQKMRATLKYLSNLISQINLPLIFNCNAVEVTK